MAERISLISVLVNVVLAAVKIIVGLIFNSAAILAEGTHSLMDVFASAISYAGIRISNKPEDERHPYGHHKFEVLSGLLITTILCATGVWILYEAYQRLLHPGRAILGYLPFVVMACSSVVNELMARLKTHYGKREHSVSLLSDGVHSRIDVYTSLGVFAGLFLTGYWPHADSLLAALIGLYILKESLSLGREAVDSLMDVSAGEEVEETIRGVAANQGVTIDSVKTQRKGAAITANLEISLASDLTVEEAGLISDALRRSLMDEIRDLRYVAIQITSHGTGTGFYRPALGRAFGWERKGRPGDTTEGPAGRGPAGECVCPRCGYRTPHERGVPCSTVQCPNCETSLQREQ